MENVPAPAPNDAPKSDPMAEIETLRSQLAEKDAKIERLSGGLERLNRKMTEKETPAPRIQDSEEPLTLRAMKAQLDAEKAERGRREIDDNIDKALDAHDLDAKGKKLLKAYINDTARSGIVAEKGKIFYKTDDSVQTIEDYITNVVKEMGDSFRPPVNPPKGRGLTTGSVKQAAPDNSLFAMSPEERSKLSKFQRDAIVRAEWAKYKQGGGR